VFKKTLCLFFFLFVSSVSLATENNDPFASFRARTHTINPHAVNSHGQSLIKVLFRSAMFSEDFSAVMPYLLHPETDLNAVLDEDSDLRVIHILAAIGAIDASHPGLNTDSIEAQDRNHYSAIDLAEFALGFFGSRSENLQFKLRHNILFNILSFLIASNTVAKEEIQESILKTIHLLNSILDAEENTMLFQISFAILAPTTLINNIPIEILFQIQTVFF